MAFREAQSGLPEETESLIVLKLKIEERVPPELSERKYGRSTRGKK
jgi:hypothetical protein